MIPPLASSLPETGRKRTVRSMSSNFLSSRIATAQGWVSTSWASTWRPPDGRRVQCPATNFHLRLSLPRSSFMLVFSGEVMASRGPSVAASICATPSAISKRTASAIFMDSPSCGGDSCQRIVTPDRARATEEFLTFVSASADRALASGPGQDDPEKTALTLFALQLDTAAVDLDRPARGGEAESGPSRLPRASLVDTVEALKYTSLVHGRYAQPRVLDLDGGFPGSRLPRPHANPPADRGVLDRVIEHVDEAEPQEGRIARDGDLLDGVEGHALLLFLREDFEVLHDIRHQPAQVDHIEARPDSAGFAPRQSQETVDEARQAVDLLEHASDHLAVAHGAQGPLQRYLPDTADGGERRAKLVRRARREPPKLLEGLVETRERVIEHHGEPTELVLGIPDGQPVGQRLRADLARRLGHGSNRREHAAREHVAAADGQADCAGHADRQDDAERPEGLAKRGLVPGRVDAMGGVAPRSAAIRHRPARRPAGRLVNDRAAFGDPEERDAHAMTELSQIAGLLPIDLLDRREIRAELLVQRAVESRPDEEERAGGKDADDERQHAGMPQGKTRPDAEGPRQAH